MRDYDYIKIYGKQGLFIWIGLFLYFFSLAWTHDDKIAFAIMDIIFDSKTYFMDYQKVNKMSIPEIF
jgi:hypothetical protein